MKEILETIVKSLVEDGNDIVVTEKETDKVITFEVKVPEKSMGKIIGKQGRVAKSIRTIMKSVASKEHKKVIIDFVE